MSGAFPRRWPRAWPWACSCAVLLLARVVDGDDVRVRQPGRQARLADEPLPEPLVGGRRRVEELDRDEPVELAVARHVDDRHAAVAERALEPVAAAGDGLDAHPPFPCSSSVVVSSVGGGAGGSVVSSVVVGSVVVDDVLVDVVSVSVSVSVVVEVSCVVVDEDGGGGGGAGGGFACAQASSAREARSFTAPWRSSR